MALVIVGNGMVGARLCEHLAQSGWTTRQPVIVFGEEALPAYDRVHLSDLFALDKGADELVLRPARWYADAGIDLHTKERVTRLDPGARRVHTASGLEVPYDRLVLATGSRPLRPDVPGLDLPGVHVYRSVEDREAIAPFARAGARVAVLGAGLLGIELAAALAACGAEVTLLERAPRLLPRHLESSAADLLAREASALGIDVRLSQELVRVRPSGSSVSLDLRDAATLHVDLLVVATGVRPRDELARDAGLTCDRRGGVIVDDTLATSDPRIAAIGECVVHREVHYGLVAPGLAMAEVLAERLQGSDVRFEGVPFSARLKLDAIEISMLGESESGDAATRALTAVRGDAYRRVLVRDGRIIGATAVGAWAALPRIQEAIARREPLGFRARRRFERRAELWGDVRTRPIESWPDDATVCSCTGVTCGALRRARAAGCGSAAQLARQTGASRVCGACAPLLAELCGEHRVDRTLQRPLLAVSLLGVAAAAALVGLGPIPLADTVQLDLAWDAPWRSSLGHQITGFSIVAAAVGSLGLSLRKRWSRVAFGAYTRWRVLHAALGALTLGLVGLHTGLHLGVRLNLALMASFLTLAVLGAGAGALTAVERRLDPLWGGRLRRTSTLVHVLALTPFCVLLGFHVLKVYYF